jgi:hypothetical protein
MLAVIVSKMNALGALGLERHQLVYIYDRLCGLVVRVLGYRSGGPGSIPGTNKKKKKKKN